MLRHRDLAALFPLLHMPFQQSLPSGQAMVVMKVSVLVMQTRTALRMTDVPNRGLHTCSGST